MAPLRLSLYNISVTCLPPPHTNSTSSRPRFSFGLMDAPSDGNCNRIEIYVEPNSFDKRHPLTRIREGWFRNLSSVPISKEVQALVQLGENFSLPATDSAKLTTEFIKNIENNLRYLPNNIQMISRNRMAPVINKLPTYVPLKASWRINLNFFAGRRKNFSKIHLI